MKLAYKRLSTCTILAMEVSLENIIKECKRYQKFAQKLLYDKYSPAMNGLCLRYVNDPESVKKIIQAGFITVFLNIKHYKDDELFEDWIKHIFIKTALLHIKQVHKNKELMIDPDAASSFSNENDNTFSRIRADDISEIDLLRILGKLTVSYRIIYNMFCIDNITHDKVTELLGVEAKISKKILSKARSIVQQELFKMVNKQSNSTDFKPSQVKN